MATKSELEDEINETLDTNMEWSKMKKEDLDLLLDLIEGGHLIEPMVKLQVKKHGKDALENQVDGWVPGKFLGEVL